MSSKFFCSKQSTRRFSVSACISVCVLSFSFGEICSIESSRKIENACTFRAATASSAIVAAVRLSIAAALKAFHMRC